jgi:hypothetical protein
VWGSWWAGSLRTGARRGRFLLTGPAGDYRGRTVAARQVPAVCGRGTDAVRSAQPATETFRPAGPSERCSMTRDLSEAADTGSELGFELLDFSYPLLELRVRRVLADAAQRPAQGVGPAAGDAGRD